MKTGFKMEALAWVVAATWATAAVWPATFWYSPGTMKIDDVYVGQDIELKYEGGAERPFLGSYSVVLRDIHIPAIVAEMGSEKFNYDPARRRPDPLKMDWWTAGYKPIMFPEVGDYVLETCWTVHDSFFGLVPSKTTCIESNIFSVKEMKQDEQQDLQP